MLVPFSDEEVRTGKIYHLQGLFADLLIFAGGRPADAAMFTDTDDKTAYFSPGAVTMAKALVLHWGGPECSAQPRTHVDELLVGEELYAWPLLAELVAVVGGPVLGGRRVISYSRI